MEDITLLSILTEAKEMAERIEPEEARITVEYRVAKAIRDLGREANFGSYVADALAEWEARLHARSRASSTPEAQAERERLDEIEAEAKRLCLAGEVAQAEWVFMSGEDLRDSHLQEGALGARYNILRWLLEAGDLAAAERFREATDWLDAQERLWAAYTAAEAHIAAGRRTAGLRILFGMWPSPDDPKGNDTLAQLSRYLWDLGIGQEAVRTLREAAAGALAAAARDVRLPLPHGLASRQLDMGDREGAVATLRGVLGLAAPLEYEPPEPRQIGLSLKPAARRWLKALDDLPRLLAHAGLDREAFALLHAPAAKQLKVIENIGCGQAARGAFAAAFATLELIRTGTLTTAAEPSTVTFMPDGRISVYVQPSPTRPVEDLERKGACRAVAFTICRHAVERGDTETFRRADAAGREVAPADWDSTMERFLLNGGLRDFAGAGQATAALSYARTVAHPGSRVTALLGVAEGIAGVGKRPHGSGRR